MRWFAAPFRVEVSRQCTPCAVYATAGRAYSLKTDGCRPCAGLLRGTIVAESVLTTMTD